MCVRGKFVVTCVHYQGRRNDEAVHNYHIYELYRLSSKRWILVDPTTKGCQYFPTRGHAASAGFFFFFRGFAGHIAFPLAIHSITYSSCRQPFRCIASTTADMLMDGRLFKYSLKPFFFFKRGGGRG